MVGERDSHQIVDLALLKVTRSPNRRYRWNGLTVSIDLDAKQKVSPGDKGSYLINDVDAVEVVDRGDAGEIVKLEAGGGLQKPSDLHHQVGWNDVRRNARIDRPEGGVRKRGPKLVDHRVGGGPGVCNGIL